MTMAAPGLDHSKYTVILPTYNEVQNIPPMVEELLTRYPGVRVLVVDDDSYDGTPEAVRELMARHPGVDLLSRDPQDRGLTASLMDGIAAVTTEHFVAMDADFQHPPAVVEGIMRELAEGHVLVVGTRNDIRAMSVSRRLASWGANFLAQAYLFVHRQRRPHDLMSGFFGGQTAVWREVILSKGARFERRGFKVLFDLMKFGPRDVDIAEVRYDFGERAGGESKLNSRVIISLLRQCGVLGRALAFLVGAMQRRHPQKERDQDAAATVVRPKAGT